MKRFTSEQVQEVVEVAAGVAVALQGGLKGEIERYTALKAEVEAKVAAVGGMDKASAVIAEADAYAAKVRAEADERAEGAKSAARTNIEWNDRLRAKEAILNAQESRLVQAQAKLASDKANWAAGVEEQERRLAMKEAQLKAREEAQERERTILAEREQKLKERLAKLAEPV